MAMKDSTVKLSANLARVLNAGALQATFPESEEDICLHNTARNSDLAVYKLNSLESSRYQCGVSVYYNAKLWCWNIMFRNDKTGNQRVVLLEKEVIRRRFGFHEKYVAKFREVPHGECEVTMSPRNLADRREIYGKMSTPPSPRRNLPGIYGKMSKPRSPRRNLPGIYGKMSNPHRRRLPSNFPKAPPSKSVGLFR